MRITGRLAAIVVFAVLASGAAYAPQITNGHDADPGEWPFMVGLLTAQTADDFEAQFCGGSLVDASWVLTAAHCVTGDTGAMAAGDLDLLVGGHDLRAGDGARVAAASIVVHDGYDPVTNDNDLALVRLSSAQTATRIVRATDTTHEGAGTVATLVGWGGTSADQNNQTYASVLQEADMPVVDDVTCAEQLGGFVGARMLCAGAPEDDADGGVDACQGDSGGPLFTTGDSGQPVQIGIVSFGPTCGRTLTAYTQVSAFVEWIAATISGAVQEEPDDLPMDVFRISGANRYATAADFATDRFTAPVPVVYLVTGAAFADALAVAPLAAMNRGPVLLTERDQLPAETGDALRALQPGRVAIIGGEGAVSAAVAEQVSAITGEAVARAAGADRYATAVEVSKRVLPSGELPEGFPALIVASGTSFADALGGAAAASGRSVSLLLTDAATLPEATAAELRRIDPTTVFLLGGTGVVSDGVAAAIRALGIEVERIAGTDRYDTSSRIATRIFGTGATEVVSATGRNFPDALVAGVLGLPLLLVPAPDAVPTSITDAVSTLGAQVITIMGGPGNVSNAQARTLGEARS